ncbi:hypothetical protein J2W32_003759 [Variovorax boronicumulans]|uniref:DUF2848 domain-containing protein n=1 Tax=Variovorax boronicumulans TaxID=436515 RepID=A0AAW8D430_9BURK|nr:DUF2848 family protein [Variovorax boronicumulans]MDP9894979.1 hypothetical protein [Variovorax boronicumulans]MDQ0038472.1 hypothetical protein [Variovorax boronicumulans]MDQ0044636.1 hypothetical protein [Variovorax boronicumulans]MDQ0054701.1 hypothetical protein [Variovorax boronicumulans]
MLYFSCATEDADGGVSGRVLAVEPKRFIIAGWTGRDAVAIEHHIEELEALGVPRPSGFPLYYRAGLNLLSQSSAQQVLGADSSGEAEPVLFFAEDEWWLTVGSDHTDRTVEGYSVAVSKQMCPKPLATAAWRWSDIASRQDEIQLESSILEGGKWVAYQAGTLASIRPLQSLRDGAFDANRVGASGSFLFCGTLGAIPNAEGKGIRPAGEMQIALRDPRTKRSIIHRYSVETLPIVA